VRGLCCLLAAGLAVAAEGPAVQDRVRTLRDDGFRLLDEGAPAEAMAAFQEIARLDPLQPEAALGLVLVQARRGDVGSAAPILETWFPSRGPSWAYGRGVIGFLQGDLDAAARWAGRALEGYRERTHVAGEAAARTLLGNVHLRKARPDDAERQYELAAALLETIGDRRGLVDLLDNMASALLARGEVASAIERQRRALDLRAALGDRTGLAKTCNNLGASLERLGRAEDAAAAYRRAIGLWRQVGDPRGEATSRRNLGLLLASAGELDAAIAELEKVGLLHAERGDRASQAGALQELGEMADRAGQGEKAIASLAAAAEGFADLGRDAEEASARQHLGELHLASGDLEAARRAFEAALRLRLAIGDAAGESSARDRLGVVHHRRGDLAAAEDMLAAALAVAEEVGDASLESTACNDLAGLRFTLGDPAEALRMQERALALQRRSGDRGGSVTSLNNLGAIYHAVGDHESALRHLRQALEEARAIRAEPSAEALVRSNLGVVLEDVGDLEHALREHREALRLRTEGSEPRDTAYSHFNIGETLRRIGRHGEARENLSRALEAFRGLSDPRGEAFTLNGLGELHHDLDAFGASVATHREALAIAAQVGIPDEAMRAHAGIGRGLERLGRPAEAQEAYLAAIEQAERVRARILSDTLKARFLAGRVSLYEGAIRTLLASAAGDGAMDAAFHLAEGARARSLLDLLAEVRADLRGDIDPDLLGRERAVLGRLAAAAGALERAPDGPSRERAAGDAEDAEEELELLKIEIRSRAPRYGEIVYPSLLSLEETRKNVLENGEAMLLYFVGDQASYRWVVHPAGATMAVLPAREVIERQVEAFLEEIRDVGEGFGADELQGENGRELARTLLPAELPAGIVRILVVPDGILHYLPFEALARVEGRPLVEAVEVAYVPSASLLRALRQPRGPGPPLDFLGVGGPLPGGEAPALPFSRRELERAADRFPESRRRLLLGREATKEAIERSRLDQFRFVHFATHGRIDEEQPGRSGLALSARAAAPGSGLLTLNEVFRLRLNAEAVVLSACSSGRGEVVRGEGLVGFTRAFLYAGARAVVVSLWNVNDRSTADFMDSFYAALREGAHPAAALREAKRSFLASPQAGLRHPSRWAAFVLVGDPKGMGA
jgi:tetratricopeptide (TPR) repeat protein